uniref:Uncharacterized protein n=1 Tax=uncultured marine virus TaxID=186617 RepID=A0A0F7L6K7_9VIRU|nr:hypothetical protein [uncultured marine virus]
MASTFTPSSMPMAWRLMGRGNTSAGFDWSASQPASVMAVVITCSILHTLTSLPATGEFKFPKETLACAFGVAASLVTASEDGPSTHARALSDGFVVVRYLHRKEPAPSANRN